MTSRLVTVEKYWPERKIFQGAGRAYARYSNKPQSVWEDVEKPLWENVLSVSLPGRTLLDVGSGSGKVVGLAISRFRNDLRGRSSHILAYEPNVILRTELRRKYLEIDCRRSFPATLVGTPWEEGFDLITANMVVNHLDPGSFARLFKSAMAVLNPEDGIFAFTVPDPAMKAIKFYPDSPWRPEFIAEEQAPWGGMTRYYHRSVPFYEAYFLKHGVCFDFVQYGYADSVPEERLRWMEREKGKSLHVPERLMVLVRKKKLIPDSLVHPRSLVNRRKNPYELYGQDEKYLIPHAELLRGPHEPSLFLFPSYASSASGGSGGRNSSPLGLPVGLSPGLSQ